MRPFLSPKEVALAIGASESSLKRWTDVGLLNAVRTAGGHRRIPRHEAIRFIRSSSATLVRPEVLGLNELGSVGGEIEKDGPSLVERLYSALKADEHTLARGLILAMYVGGQTVATICDGPVREAMGRLGELYRHDEKGVFIEHRATDTCVQSINQIRTLLPPPAEGAKVAVGGAPSGDPYLLPSLIAGTVLLEQGYSDHNMGPDTPLDSLLAAIEHYRPRLVWLAVSSAREPRDLSDYVVPLSRKLAELGGELVIGGRGAEAVGAGSHGNVRAVRSMAELAAMAQGLKREEAAA